MRFFVFLLSLFLFATGINAQVCSDAESGSLDVMPPLPPGGVNYPPGTVVNMCFTLTEFNTPEANWFHAVIPVPGPGFDVSTLTPVSAPTSCAGNGTWGWYDSWTSCSTGNMFGPGFAFDGSSGLGCGGTANDGDPGNNFGDGSFFCPGRVFCWEITTVATPVSCNAEAYLTRVFLYGDGEAGSWNNSQPCGSDEPLCWPQIDEVTAEVDRPCPGNPFTLTGSFASEAGCGVLVEWTGPGGFTSNDLVTTANMEGDYTLNVNPDGCTSFSVTVNASYDNSTPTLTPGPSTTFCFGETVTLTGAGADSYRFTSPSGAVFNTNPVTFTADPSTAGIWTMVATTLPDCDATLITEVIVLPELMPEATAMPQPLCVGDDITLTGTGAGPGGTYTWGGDAPASNNNPHTFTVNNPGNFVATLTVTDAGGCPETIDVPYTVSQNPIVNIVANPMMACEGDQIDITASGGGTYSWSPGGETSAQITVFPTQTTTYTVTVTNADGCTEEEDVTIEIQPLLDPADLSCNTPDASTITWEWPAVSGADFYQIFINGSLVEGNWTDLMYTVSNLQPLTSVEIRVIAFSNNNVNCPGQEAVLECMTPDCNPVEFFLETPLEHCFNPANGPIDLFIGVFGDDANEGNLVWTGPGFGVPTGTPARWFPPGPGTWTLTATFTLFSGTCPYSEDFTFTINEAADARIVAPTTACVTDEITVQLQGAANASASYNWDFDGATVVSGSDEGPYTLSFPAAGTYNISLTTDLEGCESTDDHTITVDDQLEVPQVICQLIENNRVIFTWDDVPNATGYDINVVTGQSGTLNNNTFEVTGLSAGEDVTIIVTALGNGACGNRAAEAHTCTARQCPDAEVIIDTSPATFCAIGTNSPVALELTVNSASSPSDTVWLGPGVEGTMFFPDSAGVGTHTITATVFVDDCPFDASVEFIVLPLPTADFTATDTVCVNSAATISYTGDADVNTASFNWDFDGGVIVAGSNAGPYEISWPAAGDYTVRLMVEDQNNCASTLVTQTVTVIDPIPAPVISCVNPQLDQVTFEWTEDPNATGYQVTHISGPMGTQMGNTYVVSGINETDVVVIEVVALGNGPCGNSAATEASCSPRVCDEFNVTIDAPGVTQFCQDNSGSFVVLTASIDGGDGTGTYSWSGPGISNDTFYVDAADLGQNEITVVYEETGCFYSDMLSLTVIELPNANFSFDLSEVCIDSVAILTSEVAMPMNSTYVWDFDGGTASPGTGAGPHSISWPTAGTKTVTLTLTVDGCPMTESRTINVIDPLPAPAPFCDGNDLNSTTISWPDVTPNQGYGVSVNGGTEIVVNGTSHTVNGLVPDSMVTVAVRVLGNGPCGDGPSATIQCAAASCPDLTADFSANVMAFCLDMGTDQSVALSAVVSGGAGGGTFVFSGQGVNNNVFDPVIAGVGTHTITMVYEEAGPCSLTDDFEIQVFGEPMASFELSSTSICSNQFVTVTFNGTAAAGTVYNWDFDGGTIITGSDAGPYQISWPTAGTYNVNLSIDAPGNCSAVAPQQSVTVSEPLAALNVECSERLLQSVTFSWGAIANATGYEVTYDGSVDTITTLSFPVNNLNPDQTVSITVRPLGPMPCGDGDPVTVECTSLPCPDITVDIQTPVQSFCLIDNPTAVALTASSSGGDMTGTFVWSGNGVMENAGNYSFDPAEAGAGSHVISVLYTETGGCTGTAEFTLDVFDGPFASINLAASPICLNETATVAYVGNDLETATFDWDFDGATVTNLGNENYALSWPAAGTYQVILGVTLNGCFTADTVSVEVVQPLETPQPVCETVELTRIVFSWPAVANATAYRVSINNGPSFDQAETSYTASGLSDDETVEITVIALGDAPCGNSAAGSVSCTTIPCPDVVLQLSAAQTDFCTGANDAPVALEYTATGGFGNGTAIWSGIGVVTTTDSAYAFDPTGLEPGTYELRLDYVEMICTYSRTMTMQINATPEASINASNITLCSTSSMTVNFNGIAGSAASYDWDFDGAMVTDLGNENYTLSWDNAGTYTVALEVSQTGCNASTSFSVEVNEPPTAGQQFQPLEICANSGEVVALADLLTGADEGGVWTPGIGAPATVDAGTGSLSTTNMAAGTYEYIYTVEGGFCEDASTTVSITIQPSPTANAGADQVLTCAMGMVSLNGSASVGGSELTYAWTGPDGNPVLIDADAAMIDVAIPGIYTLTVTSDIGCSASDQVEVRADTEVPVPEIELNDISCFSEMDGTILVNNVQGGRPPYSYSLNGGAATNTTFFTGLDAGEYIVKVTDANGCFSEVLLDITRPDQLSVSIDLPNDVQEYDEGERVVATANISGGTVINTIVWQPDSLNLSGELQSNVITFIADETRTISVTVTDENGCSATDLQTILVRKDQTVFIPSGFSPNGDNVNDIFFIGANNEEVLKIQSFLVFNRWGEAVFENYDFVPNDPVEGWDGYHRQEPLNPAVFAYVAVVEFVNGDVIVYKGDVTLVR